MDKECKALWQVRTSYTGVFSKNYWSITIAQCSRPSNHEGKHLAKTRSNVNNEVADIIW